MHAIEHTYVSLLADVARLTGFSEIRGSYEGLQWCLIEAPKLEKHILSCVETDREVDLSLFPVWLQRLARGSVMDPQLMRYLRQLLLFCYKANVTYDNETLQMAFRNFLDVNRVVGEFGNGMSKSQSYLLDQVRSHCQSVLYRFREREIIPFHGPGAVTTSKDVWEKWYSTIEYLYPYSDWYYLYANRDHQSQLPSLDDCITARITAVPKDSRGPRLICVHPAEAIWLQQGLRIELERAISLNRRCYGPWPRGHIHFNDQQVNGLIALKSSQSRRYATIDMKEASDRISDTLIQFLFGRKYKYFGCCRAQEFTINQLKPKGVTDNMNCYAPMGNATTFPVQSLVFWAICVASMQRHGFHQPGAVFVFGDDIVIPAECAELVIDDLESFGLLVNRSKSFWRGAFRESCGVDAFNGVDVTPIRWKTTIDAKQPVCLQSLSDLGMRLRIAGYEEAAASTYETLNSRLGDIAWRFGDSKIRKVLRAGKFSGLSKTNNPDHGGIAEYTALTSQVWEGAYWHRPYQRFVSPVFRLEAMTPLGHNHDWNHVLESVCSLERTGRSSVPDRSLSREIRLNRGWIDIL